MQASSGASVYRIGDVTVDTLGARLLRNGQEVPITPKAYRVLLHLLRERNRLVSKEELIGLFWADTAVNDEALTQCIARLRRALGDDPRNPTYLKTVARMGYRFVGPVEEVAPNGSGEGPLREPAQVGAAPLASESGVPARPRLRWLLAGAVTVALLVAGLRWSAWLSNPSPGVQANRIVSHETEQWEVAWWKLNEGTGSKISDSIHGLTAILPAGVSWTQGISGPGLLFTGREQLLRGSDPGVLPKADAPRTMTAWIKTGTTNADSTPIFLAGEPTPDSDGGFGIVLHESGAAACGYGHFPLVGKETIDDNRWHQVTGIFEGRESRRMRLFVDGVEQTSAIGPAVLSTARQSQWAIGTGITGGTAFRGALDDVRVYERALRADEIHSLYRCLAGASDIQLDGRGSYQFVPVFGDHVETIGRGLGENSARVRNTGIDVAGVTLARPDPDCGLRSIHGVDIGQDLNIEAQLRVPLGPDGAVTDAGPFFRSRSANPGDGIIGGTSAGFWVQLDSTGQVRVRRLHPNVIIAFSAPLDRFDPSVFHKLEVAVHEETLQVALDDRLLTFDAAGVQTASVTIAPAWETASPKGINGGSGGIAFSCTRNRGQAGGQEARNILIKPYRALISQGS